MLGFSIYFEDNVDIKKEVDNYKGFDLAFTSLHYPSDGRTYDKFLKLVRLCKNNGIDICVDINNRTLENHPDLVDMGLILRLDFGFTPDQISSLSYSSRLAINASTVSKEFLAGIKEAGTNMDKILGIHNYYPLEYSGLGESYFLGQNQLLKSYGIRLTAFIPGNRKLRGPVYRGLPTLEKDRYQNPYQSFLAMNRTYDLDSLIIAEDIKEIDRDYIIKFIKEKIVSLPVSLIDRYADLGKIRVRNDISDYIVRNERQKSLVKADNPREIRRGDIVILNENAGRYSGEIEIIKKDLGIDEQRNVIGRVEPAYEHIIDYIKGGDIIDFDRR